MGFFLDSIRRVDVGAGEEPVLDIAGVGGGFGAFGDASVPIFGIVGEAGGVRGITDGCGVAVTVVDRSSEGWVAGADKPVGKVIAIGRGDAIDRLGRAVVAFAGVGVGAGA